MRTQPRNDIQPRGTEERDLPMDYTARRTTRNRLIAGWCARRLIIASSLAVSCAELGGCVAFRIEEDLKALDERLHATNERLTTVEASLKDSTASLKHTNDALDQLRGISESLQNLDEHLASLRKTAKNVDDVIPGGDVVDPAPAQSPSDRR